VVCGDTPRMVGTCAVQSAVAAEPPGRSPRQRGLREVSNPLRADLSPSSAAFPWSRACQPAEEIRGGQNGKGRPGLLTGRPLMLRRDSLLPDPWARAAHGPARRKVRTRHARPRPAGSCQPARLVRTFLRTAGLKQPTSRRTTGQSLGRRNIAPVPSTELDPALHSRPRWARPVCTAGRAGLQGPQVRRDSLGLQNRAGAVRSSAPTVRRVAGAPPASRSPGPHVRGCWPVGALLGKS
jgi:hypothetical protein